MHFAQLCSVCGQEHEPWRDRETLAKMRGEDKYNFCSCCGRPPENPRDAGYRRKWKKWDRQKRAQARVDAAQRQREKAEEDRRGAEAASEEYW